MAERSPEYKNAISSIAKRIKDNWGTPTEFHRQSGIPVANYTVARTLDNSLDCPAAPTVILIASYAGFKNEEVAELLTKMGDTVWPRLIGKGEALAVREQAMLDAVREIVKKTPQMWVKIKDHLDLLASASGVDVSKFLAKLG